jgi:hypothetical protein
MLYRAMPPHLRQFLPRKKIEPNERLSFSLF